MSQLPRLFWTGVAFGRAAVTSTYLQQTFECETGFVRFQTWEPVFRFHAVTLLIHGGLKQKSHKSTKENKAHTSVWGGFIFRRGVDDMSSVFVSQANSSKTTTHRLMQTELAFLWSFFFFFNRYCKIQTAFYLQMFGDQPPAPYLFFITLCLLSFYMSRLMNFSKKYYLPAAKDPCPPAPRHIHTHTHICHHQVT